MLFTNGNILKHAFHILNEGIVILDAGYKILCWNDSMEYLSGIAEEESLGRNIYDMLPNLKKPYIVSAFQSVFDQHSKLFFSASFHKGLVNTSKKINLKVTKIPGLDDGYLLLEFIDVTPQFLRAVHLENIVSQLQLSNEEYKNKEEALKSLAYYDSLTGIANRTLFYETGESLCASLKLSPTLLCAIFIDIDNFKEINDAFGHQTGDLVLVAVSKGLIKATRTCDMIARLGGDEFIMLFSVCSHQDIIHIADRIIHYQITIPFQDQEIRPSLSMGISIWDKEKESLEELIAHADRAMYKAKSSGGNRWHLWDPGRTNNRCFPQ